MPREKQDDPSKVTLKNVRLSFAHVFRPKPFGEGGADAGEPKYQANFLLDPDDKAHQKLIDQCEDAIDYVKKAKWASKPPKLGPAKIALRDGEDVDYDGYEGMMFVRSSSARKPRVLDRDKTELVEADGIIYSGCYVDAIVRFWAQDNRFGKRINASLEGVRFRGDGEAFGAAPLDPDEFDDLEDEDDKPSRRSRSRDDDDADEKPSRRSRSRDDDEDEKPSRRRRAAEEDDEEEKPSRRRRAAEEDDEEEKPSRRRRAAEEDEDEPPRRRRASKDDDEEEKPSRRRRAAEEDEDEPPRRRRAANDDDDEDDAPRRRRRA